MKHIHCPVNGWDCPYYTDDGHPCRCTLSDPLHDCDDFAVFWDEGDDFIDDDWEHACWECGCADQDTTHKVECCNMCETAEYFYSVKSEKKG